jgi:hypothetical protein
MPIFPDLQNSNLGGPPQGAPGVVRPPPGHAGGGWPPCNFRFFNFLFCFIFNLSFYLFIYFFKNSGVFGNFGLTLLRIHILLPN